MKIISIRINGIPSFTPTAKRWWKLTSKIFIIEIDTDEGTFRYVLSKGLCTDFRSGSSIVDYLVPWCDNIFWLVLWVIHDVNFYGFLSFKRSNEMLKAMFEYFKLSKNIERLTLAGIKVFGKKSYTDINEWDSMKPKYKSNLPYIHFECNAKPKLPAYQILEKEVD